MSAECRLNDITEKGYRDFLSQLLLPTLKRISKSSEGLDYGSGPNPSLSILFRENQIKVDDYDIYFANNTEALTKTYDFITCSETAEHFKDPRKEFQQINKLLKPKGLLALMTLTFDPEEVEFEDWFYRLDPTHVFFYQVRTLEFVAGMIGAELEKISNRVFLFKLLS